MAGTQVGVAACAIAESAPRQWRLWDLKRGDLAKTGQSCSWQRWPWMEAVTAVWRSARLHGPGWSESHQASSLALEASAPLASKCTASTRGRRSFPLSQHASISARRVSSALLLLPIHSPPSDSALPAISEGRSRYLIIYHLNAATSWPAAANRTSRISWVRVREHIARTCPTLGSATSRHFPVHQP